MKAQGNRTEEEEGSIWDNGFWLGPCWVQVTICGTVLWAAVQLNVGKPGQANVHQLLYPVGWNFTSQGLNIPILLGYVCVGTEGWVHSFHTSSSTENLGEEARGTDRGKALSGCPYLQGLSWNYVELILSEATGTRDKHVEKTRDVWQPLSWIWSLSRVFRYVQRTGEYAKVEEVIAKLKPRLQRVQDPRRLI